MKSFLVHLWYKIINPFRIAFWFITRPRTRAVKCLIEHNGKFVLVRHTYGHKQWTTPGGGVDKNESSEEAVRREMKEELGLELGDVKLVGSYVNVKNFKTDDIEIFYTKVTEPKVHTDEIEIKEFGWFAPHELPADRFFRVDMLFAKLNEIKNK